MRSLMRALRDYFGAGRGQPHELVPLNLSWKQHNLAGHESVEAGAPSFSRAIDSTGYGKFHFMLFVFVGMTYSAVAMETTMVSFVIPSAKCDFSMSSEDAGYLTALPMLGMTLGSFFWGCLADLLGRKKVMVVSLLTTGLCGVASSVAQYFPLFVAFRVVNGFALVGALSICLPFLGEFQPAAYREKILCWMELFWTVGIIGTPCLAWLVIPIDMRYEDKYFKFSSWNAYVAASATPCLLLAAWASVLPESPKFLMEVGEHDKALQVFRYMFKVNTGKSPTLYPVESLKEKTVSVIYGKPKSEKSRRSVAGLVRNLTSMFWTVVGQQYRWRTLLVCWISFGLTASYYTLMMWFPELFTRFQAYEHQYPGRASSVCLVSNVFSGDREEALCKTQVDSKVFLNTVIVGLACIPTSLWLPLCVHRLGTKFFMIFCLTVAGAVTMGMYFVINSSQNLVLSAVFEALTSLALVSLYCSIVDIFPTNIRVMATGLCLSIGRVGGLMGNLVFGFMIEKGCLFPILLFSALLTSTGVMSFLLPSNKTKELL